MEALELSPGLTAEDRGYWPITTQEAVKPQQCIENNHDPMQEDHLVQAIRLGGKSPGFTGSLDIQGVFRKCPPGWVAASCPV